MGFVALLPAVPLIPSAVMWQSPLILRREPSPYVTAAGGMLRAPPLPVGMHPRSPGVPHGEEAMEKDGVSWMTCWHPSEVPDGQRRADGSRWQLHVCRASPVSDSLVRND